MTEPAPTPAAIALRSLAGLELAVLRHRGVVRRRLNVGEEELTALLYLAYHGGVTQRRLQDVTTLSRSGAGAMIQRLEQDDFVERRSDRNDRRVRFVELSAGGRARLQSVFSGLTEAAERVLAELRDDELETLSRLLDALTDAARDHGGGDPAPLSTPTGPDPIWRRWA